MLTPADDEFHLLKSDFTVPFVCGCRDLGEALRRIGEGASMLRTKGEPGTGNIVEAVRHMRKVNGQIRKIVSMSHDELMTEAKNLGAPFELLLQIKTLGKLPVVNFAVAGLFEFDGAAGGFEGEELVDVDGGGFGLVYAAFGGEQDGVDGGFVLFVEDEGGGVGGHADDVFVVGGDGKAGLADAAVVFLRVDAVPRDEQAEV